MIEQIVADFGGLNILVNNAGLAIRKPFKDTTPEEWRSQIDVNLLGAIHCATPPGRIWKRAVTAVSSRSSATPRVSASWGLRLSAPPGPELSC